MNKIGKYFLVAFGLLVAFTVKAQTVEHMPMEVSILGTLNIIHLVMKLLIVLSQELLRV